ncbi:Hypothetical predicted protein [Paramuricea clavata]|uniref:Uncharacterized protein n=1 Tax=Paramuricea clavata TaxID=317549 RepID=A0A6S7HL48_PARCT|nr:Hypothetical predicted protein [Paramuricea clavata]
MERLNSDCGSKEITHYSAYSTIVSSKRGTLKCIARDGWVNAQCKESFKEFKGYVDSMKELLFSLSREEMKTILSKYIKKTPKPLNFQFSEKLSKSEAVKKFQAKQQRNNTPLFPPGAVLMCSTYFVVLFLKYQ